MKTRNYALVASWSLLLMAVTVGIVFGYAHSILVSVGNPTLTLTNIQNATGLFGLEIISWVIVFITDIMVSLSFYLFFPAN